MSNEPSLEQLIYQLDSSESSADNQPLDPQHLDPFKDGIDGDSDINTDDIEPNNSPKPDKTEDPDDGSHEEASESSEEDDKKAEGESSDGELSSTSSDANASTSDDEYDYRAYYNLLKSQGILVLDDEYEFDDTAEGLQKAFQDAQKNIYNNAYSSLRESFPEEFLPILEYVSKGGQDIKDLISLYSEQQNVSSLDVDTEANQVALLRAYLKETSSFSDEKINREIEKAKLGDFLLEEATEAKLELQKIYDKKKNEMAKAQEAAQLAEQEKQDELRRQMNSVIEDSKVIAAQRKNKVKAFMFNVSEINGHKDTGFNRTLQQVAANPEHLIQLADMLLDYDSKKGFNVERLQEKSKAAAIRTFKEQLDAVTGAKAKVSGKGSKQARTNFN